MRGPRRACAACTQRRARSRDGGTSRRDARPSRQVESLDALVVLLQHAPGARTRAAIVLELARPDLDRDALVAAPDRRDAQAAVGYAHAQHLLALVQLDRHHALAAVGELGH